MIRLPKFLQRSNAPVEEAPPVLEGPVQDEGIHGTLIEHLVELRTRIIRAALAVLMVFLVMFPWSRDWYALLAEPMIAVLPQGGQMIATDVVGVFLVPVKVTLMLAFLIALPVVLWQVWAFIAPGLYQHEKSLAIPLMLASLGLFAAGMAFAYFVVFPSVFGFMVAIAPEGVAWMTDIDKYLSFVLTTFLAFGITFEVPVVVIVLVRMGIVSLEKLRAWRPYVIVGAFVIGAIFTPPDVMSQVLLAVPLWLLYELGIVLAQFVKPVAKAIADTEADQTA
ncbi:MAG: Sec-independent protein translocase protein TatC [Pseudomonadota bacterium]|jgi:sec-independent protein translocase protein TatC